MFSLRPRLLPDNRYWADEYLSSVWLWTHRLTDAFRPSEMPEMLISKFQAYMDFEDKRLEKTLAEFKHDIDELATVSLILGPGRLEKNVVALVYSLLKRDLEVFKLAQTEVLHRSELSDASMSLEFVLHATCLRGRELQSLLAQQRSGRSQIKEIASGLYEHMVGMDRDGEDTIPMKRFLDLRPLVITDEELNRQTPSDDSRKLLHYSSVQKGHNKLGTWMYDPESNGCASEDDKDDKFASEPVKDMLGSWYGFGYRNSQYPSNFMLSFDFHADKVAGENHFKSHEYDEERIQSTTLGKCERDNEGRIHVTFATEFPSGSKQYSEGFLNDSGSLVGRTAYEPNVSEALYYRDFLLKKTSPEAMTCRPPPSEFEKDKVQALWKYAIAFARKEIHQKAFSWKYLSERKAQRRRFIQLMDVTGGGNPRELSDDEVQDLCSLRMSIT